MDLSTTEAIPAHPSYPVTGGITGSSPASPMRVVVVSDRRLSRSALAGAVSGPADIVAEVDRVDIALGYCQDGAADVVIVDASAMAREPLSGLEPGGLTAALAQSRWLRPALTASLRRLQYGWEIDPGQVDCLTPREREVLALLSMGLSNRHMARLLGVTERTIKTHVGRILTKLNLESRLQAGLAAFVYCAMGWARPPGS